MQPEPELKEHEPELGAHGAYEPGIKEHTVTSKKNQGKNYFNALTAIMSKNYSNTSTQHPLLLPLKCIETTTLCHAGS